MNFPCIEMITLSKFKLVAAILARYIGKNRRYSLALRRPGGVQLKKPIVMFHFRKVINVCNVVWQSDLVVRKKIESKNANN